MTNSTYFIDFFASDRANPSGYGDGQIFLGSTSVVTNGSGVATFDVVLPVVTGADQVITMTSTDAAGNTSQFSQVRRSNATPFLDSGDLSLTGVSVSPTIAITRFDPKTHAQVAVIGSSAFGDGAQITVSGSFNDLNAGNSYTAVIDWGDGQTTTVPVATGPFLHGNRGFNTAHSYPAGVDAEFSPTTQVLLTQTTLGAAVHLTGQFTDRTWATGTVTVSAGRWDQPGQRPESCLACRRTALVFHGRPTPLRPPSGHRDRDRHGWGECQRTIAVAVGTLARRSRSRAVQ